MYNTSLLTESHSNRKSRSRQVSSSSSESEFEDPVPEDPMRISLMMALSAYFATVYFLKTNVGIIGFCAHGAKSDDTVTALELREC
jgi:hypothetical protein